MKKRGGRKEQEVTIVKRRGKRGHDEAHGGAWKVAFADFTMAMMALFMVLWVLQAKQAEDLAAAMQAQTNSVLEAGIGVFDGSSRTPVDLEGASAPVAREDLPSTQLRDVNVLRSQDDLNKFADVMRKLAADVDAAANVEVEVVPQGLRILIKDDAQRYMFERGSAVLNTHFEELLGRLGAVLATIDNRLILSGHTDSVPFRGRARYDNWNLSGDRALRARSVLVRSGLSADAVLQVAAQADVMPLRPEDPAHGANRRVEILLLTSEAEALYKELFGDAYSRADYSKDGVEFVDSPPRLPSVRAGEGGGS